MIELQGDREILFVINEFGNRRKTWLTQYIALTQNGQSFGSTNERDVPYALNPEKKTYVFNITRATEPKMSLQILESINNGIVFSGKYESGTKIVANAKVVVMANTFNKQHEAQLSLDRFMILKLRMEMQQVKYEFTYFNEHGDKKTVLGTNGTPELVEAMAEGSEEKWKRKFCRWAAELPKWGFNVKKNLRLRQHGYDEAYHRMKRLQDLQSEEEMPTLTQQGVPELFETESESEEVEESTEEDFGTWTIV